MEDSLLPVSLFWGFISGNANMCWHPLDLSTPVLLDTVIRLCCSSWVGPVMRDQGADSQ